MINDPPKVLCGWAECFSWPKIRYFILYQGSSLIKWNMFLRNKCFQWKEGEHIENIRQALTISFLWVWGCTLISIRFAFAWYLCLFSFIPPHFPWPGQESLALDSKRTKLQICDQSCRLCCPTPKASPGRSRAGCSMSVAEICEVLCSSSYSEAVLANQVSQHCAPGRLAANSLVPLWIVIASPQKNGSSVTERLIQKSHTSYLRLGFWEEAVLHLLLV